MFSGRYFRFSDKEKFSRQHSIFDDDLLWLDRDEANDDAILFRATQSSLFHLLYLM